MFTKFANHVARLPPVSHTCFFFVSSLVLAAGLWTKMSPSSPCASVRADDEQATRINSSNPGMHEEVFISPYAPLQGSARSAAGRDAEIHGSATFRPYVLLRSISAHNVLWEHLPFATFRFYILLPSIWVHNVCPQKQTPLFILWKMRFQAQNLNEHPGPRGPQEHLKSTLRGTQKAARDSQKRTERL